MSDTHPLQTNLARINGKVGIYLTVIKHATALTLTVVDAVKARIPK